MVYTNRFERKYLMDFLVYEKVKEKLKYFLKYDPLGDKKGRYAVSSIYFDSPDYKFYTEKTDGEKIRNKVRFRSYSDISGNSNSPIFLEIKKRINQNIFKKKLKLSSEINLFLNNSPTKEEDIVSEFYLLKETYDLKAAAQVTYIRQALINNFFPKLRITFDYNIQCRNIDMDLKNIFCKNQVLPKNQVIMEVKYNTIIPVFVKNIIENNNLTLTTFSKYCSSIDRLLIKKGFSKNFNNLCYVP